MSAIAAAAAAVLARRAGFKVAMSNPARLDPGREAYSLAMVLDESSVEDWSVIATDISHSALARARAARYELRELRGVSDERRERYFERNGTGFAVKPALARRVSIARHKLAADQPPFAIGRAEVVFCRNVLVYLDAREAGRSPLALGLAGN